VFQLRGYWTFEAAVYVIHSIDGRAFVITSSTKDWRTGARQRDGACADGAAGPLRGKADAKPAGPRAGFQFKRLTATLFMRGDTTDKRDTA
jgi:hypothetical protein